MPHNSAFLRYYRQLLRRAGYDVPLDGPDRPGDATHQAAAAFQTKMGLPVTGTATAEIIDALRAYKPEPPPPPEFYVSSSRGAPVPAPPVRPPPPPPITAGPQHRPTRGKPFWQQAHPKAPPGTPMPMQMDHVTDEDRALSDALWANVRAGGSPFDMPYDRLDLPTAQDLGGANSPLAGGDAYTPSSQTPDMPTVMLSGPQWYRKNDFDAFFNPPDAPSTPAVAMAQKPHVSMRDYILPPVRPEAPMPPPAHNPLGQVGFPWGKKYDSVTDMVKSWIGLDGDQTGTSTADKPPSLSPEQFRSRFGDTSTSPAKRADSLPVVPRAELLPPEDLKAALARRLAEKRIQQDLLRRILEMRLSSPDALPVPPQAQPEPSPITITPLF